MMNKETELRKHFKDIFNLKLNIPSEYNTFEKLLTYIYQEVFYVEGNKISKYEVNELIKNKEN